MTRSVLLYDGDCSFCRTWIDFWRKLTIDQVEYLPYQKAAARFPEVPAEDCRRGVQLLQNGERFQGAEAVCRLLNMSAGYRWLLWCYRFVPGFAWLANIVYGLIAGHRNAAWRVTRFFWGRQVEPAEFSMAAEIFSRALAIIYFIALLSFGLQLRGLVGSEGLLPAADFLAVVRSQLGRMALWRLPTIFWWGSADVTLLSITWGGVALSLISLITRAHSRWQRIIFVVLWIYYLSIVNAGQTFMSFQWDWLLVEAGFLAIFLTPDKSRVWLYRWLLFRLMLESGAVKLLSHDPTWHNLTALTFHYETQPLPTPLAWYANLAPLWFQKISAGVVFAVELVVPWLMFAPRRLRQFAGIATIAFQILIMLTGNYTFFNGLTIALCLFLFDDAFFSGIAKRWSLGRLNAAPQLARPPNKWVTAAVWTLVAFLSGVELAATAGKLPQAVGTAAAQISQFGFVNHYGLFSVMTTERMEIQVEGSLDGEHWEPYLFPYKPGPLNRRLPWVEPYQPRLDWQMWFAALSGARDNPWFIRMMVGLLRGSKPVNALFAQTPFGGATPKLVRATIYQYHFTSQEERAKTGNYWKRELKGLYFPPVGLTANH